MSLRSPKVLLSSLLMAGMSLASATALAQPNTQITSKGDAQQMIDALLSEIGGVTIKDVEYVGNSEAGGAFEDGPLGMLKGAALSTGRVDDLTYREPRTHPDSNYGRDPQYHEFCTELTKDESGDPTLTFDIAYLRVVFDLEQGADGIMFDHIVGTEEYPDQVGGAFNDGFGIFLNGTNIAMDATDSPVNINSYFDPDKNNEILEWPANEMNLNGSTPRFTTRAPVTPGSRGNELVILVCDAGDNGYDTGAFVTAFSACYGDCDGTSQCGDGQPGYGKVCDGAYLAPGFENCPAGYAGTPRCNNDPNNPHANGTCSLPAVPNGCEDINECAVGIDTCDADETCVNTVGSYECFTTVVIDEPESGLITNDPRPTIEGVGEPGETIHIGVDGSNIGSTTVDTDGKWSFEPGQDLPEGTILIEATDGESTDFTVITIDTKKPDLVVNGTQGPTNNERAPIFGSTDKPYATITIDTGDVAGVVEVQADSNGNWIWFPTADLDDGPYTWSAYATDRAGNVSDTEYAEFTVDTEPVTIAIDYPEEGHIYDPDPPTKVSGTVSVKPGGVDVTLTMNGQPMNVTVNVDQDGTWSYDFGAPLPTGEYTIEATVVDHADNTDTATVTFAVDSSGDVKITSPEQDESLRVKKPTIKGTADPHVWVDVYIDGQQVGRAQADGDGNFEVTSSVEFEDGPHRAEVIADTPSKDRKDDVDFIIDRSTTPIVIDSPADDDLFDHGKPEFAGKSAPDAEITVYVDGEPVDTFPADGSGDWSWTPGDDLEDGERTVKFVADDDQVETEAEVTVRIDTTPPVIAIIDPEDGAVLSESPEKIVVDVNEPAKITISVNGEEIGVVDADEAGEWSVEITTPLETGEYEVVAVAVDEAGNEADTESTFIVDTTAPVVIDAPVAGSVLRTKTPTVTGTAEPESDVEIVLNGEVVGTVQSDSDGDWSWTSPTELEDGDYDVIARVDSPAGDRQDETNFTIDRTTTPVVINSPDDGTITNDPKPTFEGEAAPGAIVTITLSPEEPGLEPIRETVTAEDDGTWSWEPEEDLEDSLYEVEVVADDDGVETSDKIKVIIDTQAPMVQTRDPEDGSIRGEVVKTIAGESEPDAKIAVIINGEPVGETTTDGDGNWTLDLDEPLTDGGYEAVAQATDAAGNKAQAESEFIVDTTDPVIITKPVDGAIIRVSKPTISGTAEPGATLVLTVEGDEVAEIVVDDDGSWTWTPSYGLADGPYEAQARVESPAGDRKDDVTFIIDTSTTQVLIATPEEGELVNDSKPTFTGSSAPEAIVSIIIDGEIVDTVEADENGNWTWTPEEGFEDGENTVTVEADDDGYITEDDVTFVVDTTPPVLVVDEPEDGDTLSSADDNIVSGTSEPGATIVVIVDGEPVGSTVVDEDGDWSVPLPKDLEDGETPILVTSTDEAGNTTVVELEVVVDGTPPVLSLDEIEDGDIINPSQDVTLVGTSEPGAEIVVTVDGEEIGRTTADESGNWSVPLPEDLEDGDARLVVTATDEVGNVTVEERDVIFDSTPPALVVNEPQDGDILDPRDEGQVSGKSEPGAEIEVYIDGEPVGATTADEFGDWSVPLPEGLEDGEAEILVTATDVAGNTTEVTVDVTFETPDPEMELIGGGIGSACSTTPGSDPSLLLALIFLGLVALRRRRQSQGC